MAARPPDIMYVIIRICRVRRPANERRVGWLRRHRSVSQTACSEA